MFWRKRSTPQNTVDRLGDPLPAGATARLGTGRLQHVVDQGNDGLGALAFAPDGVLLAGAGRDGRISLWEAATGRLVRVLARHDSEINTLAFAPDSRSLVAGGRDGKACLWDVAAGKCLNQVEADRVDVSSVAFSPRGDVWAAAGYCGQVRIFDARRHKLLCELNAKPSDDEERSERIVTIAFSPDGTHLATASAYTFHAEEISQERLEDFNLFSDLPALGCGDVMDHILSDPQGFADKMQQKAQNMMKAMNEEFGDAPGGHGFTFGEEGGVARGWRVGEAGRLSVWKLPAARCEVSWDLEEGAPYLLAFSADGAILASVGKSVQCWDLASRRRLAPDRTPTRWQGSPGFTAQGRTIVAPADGRGPAQVWDAVAGREIRALAPEHSWGPLALAPEGNRLAVTHGSGAVEIQDVTTGRDLLPLPRHRDWIGGLALAAAAPVAAVLSRDVHFWDRDQGAELGRLAHPCRLPALSPDGQRLAGVVAQRSGEANIVVWDWRRDSQLLDLEGVEPTALLFRDNATLLVGNALGQVGRYDLGGKRWLKILRGAEEAIDSLAISACGRFVAAGAGQRELRLWRLDTGETIREFSLPALPEAEQAPSRPPRLAFSPDDSRLAWGSPAGVFLEWEIATGKRVGRLELPERVEVCAVAFDPRQRCLAAEATALTDESQEYRLCVWDVRSGKALFESKPQAHAITELNFTPNGRVLASAGSDRSVLLWDVSSL